MLEAAIEGEDQGAPAGAVLHRDGLADVALLRERA
jgi:hypothetical protein